MKKSIIFIFLLFVSCIVNADTVWPKSHPSDAIYKQLRQYKDIFDAYFWWESGALWQEIVPVTTGPFVCSIDYTIIQNSVQHDIALKKEGDGDFSSFCGDVFVPSLILNISPRDGYVIDPLSDTTIVYSDYYWKPVSILIPKQTAYQLSISIDGYGRVYTSPPGIAGVTGFGLGYCIEQCSASFIKNTLVTLTAEPLAGHTFSGWSGACAGTGLCYVNLDSTKSVQASFIANASTKPQRKLTIKKIGEGTVTDSTGKIKCGNTCYGSFDKGSKVSLTVIPSQGFKFKKWMGACSGKKACRTKMGINKTVRAKFVPIN